MTLQRGLLLPALLFAFLLRLWGLDFGLPYEFHPDEHQYIDPAVAWHLDVPLNLSLINPPLFSYLLAAALYPWLALSPFNIESTAWITATLTYLRLWSVAASVLTVALLYPLGRRLHNPAVGLLAMILLAGTFLPTREAHFATNDTTATLLVGLVIYLSLRLYDRPTLQLYLLAGLLLGLAAAAKLTGGLAVLALLAAHFLAVPRRRWINWSTHRPLLLAGAAALATFILVSVHILWRLPEFFETIYEHLVFGSEGYKGLQMTPGSGWSYYFTVLGWGMGWLLLALAAGSLLWIVMRRYRPGYIVAIVPVALFAYMGAQQILFARFLLPAVPLLVVLAALALVWGTQRWTFFQRQRRWLWPLLVGLLLLQPLINLIWFDLLLTRSDTRLLATNWLLAEYPEETVLVKESYSVFPAAFILSKNWPFKTIQLDERGPTRSNVDYYLAHKTDLITLSSFTSARVREDSAEETARQQQLANLRKQAELVKTFDPYRTSPPDWFYLDELYGPAGETWQRVRPGPLIKIYRLPYKNQPYTTAVPSVPAPLDANFGGKLRLLGYDLPLQRVEPGGSLPLTLHWQAVERMDTAYVIFTRLLDAGQQVWGGYDRWPQETARTDLWHPGEVVTDTFALPVFPAAPDGVYTIDIGLYDQADSSGTPLPLVRDGQPIDQTSVRLGPVKVGGPPPAVTLSLPDISPQHSLQIQLGQPPVIALRGYDLAASDQTIGLTLYWESLAQTAADWSVFAHVRDSTNQPVTQQDGPAGGGVYPTSLWDPGEVIVDQVSIPAPANATGDQYRLVIGLYNLLDGSRLATPDSIHGEITLSNLELPQR